LGPGDPGLGKIKKYTRVVGQKDMVGGVARELSLDQIPVVGNRRKLMRETAEAVHFCPAS